MKNILFLLVCLFPVFAYAQPSGGGTVRLWDGTDIALVTSGKALLVDASATTQPVSGTVTCNAGTNLNTSTLATSANQTTLIGHVDGIEGLLTTIDADTGNIATSAASIDGKITACNTGAVTISALPNEGQQTMANSISVAVASNQSTLPTYIVPQTSGGWSKFKSIDLDETEEEVKSSAGQVGGWYLKNENASATRYFKFYAATIASVVVGTTVPDLTIPVPAGSAANVFTETGIEFANAITVACTTGLADNDSGAPGVGDCVANIFYK